MTAVKLMSKTYPFLIARLLLNLIAIVPGIMAIKWGVSWGRRLSGLELLLTDLLFAYCGLALFIIYIDVCRRFIAHCVRYAQIAAASEILEGREIKGSVFMFGMKAMVSRFGSIMVLMFADKMMRKVVKEITEWVMEKGKFIPEVLKTGFLSRLFSSVVKNVVYHIDEIIVSQMYQNKELGLWDGIAKGTTQYFKSWKGVLKYAFFTVLWLKIFSIAFNVAVIVFGIYSLWGDGIQSILVFLVTYKVVATLASATLVEPYQSMSMLIGFYENRKDAEPDNGLVEKLESISSRFSELLSKGKRNDDSLVDNLSSLIKEEMDNNSSGDGILKNVEKVVENMSKNKESGEVS